MKKIEEELWGGFAYPLQLAAKERLEKANPYHDTGGRFTSADKAVAPKGKKPKLKRAGGAKKSVAAQTILDAEASLKNSGVNLRVVRLPKNELSKTRLSKELTKNYESSGYTIGKKLFPDGNQDEWFILAHYLIRKSLGFGTNTEFGSYTKYDQRTKKLVDSQTHVVVAEINKKIVGAMRYSAFESDIPFAGSFRVAKGVGSAMFGQVVRIAAQRGSSIRIQALRNAVPFWTKVGFKPDANATLVSGLRGGVSYMVMSTEGVAKLAEELK